MSPAQQHVDEILTDFSIGEEHFEELMLEDYRQVLWFKGRGDSAHSVVIETAVSNRYMTVRIKPQEIPKVCMAITAQALNTPLAQSLEKIASMMSRHIYLTQIAVCGHKENIFGGSLVC
jgi:hypothetical protein